MGKDSMPLYNSRIFKVFMKYIENQYPLVAVDEILELAGMTRYEIEDQAHWFTQEASDRFYDAVVSRTQNPNIAREAGRYSVSSGALAAGQQYGLGLLKLSFVYQMAGKLHRLMSRGARLTVRNVGYNKVEVVSTPVDGVNEKPYQCENRIGTLESLAKLFTNKLAAVEHPSCLHRGGDCCRYIVSWEKTPAFVWKKIRNYSLIAAGLTVVALLTVMGKPFFYPAVLLCLAVPLALSNYALHLENKELTQTILSQGDAAKDLLDEINTRHNNSLLVQEIGQALSSIRNIEKLVNTVVNIMVKRMDFDRGLIMLANDAKSRLVYRAGYGYSREMETMLKQTEFHLDNPESKGPFIMAFVRKAPFLIEDISKIEKNLSPRSLDLTKLLGVESLICVPILFENESLGILAVDNIRSNKRFSESDVHLLMGVASQTAVGILNAKSFVNLQESERKYRELVESANSIILRMHADGTISFFNEFAQQFFGYKESEITGRKAYETILPNSDAAKQDLEKLIAVLRKDPERKIVSENIGVRRDGKTVWVAWTYKPINGDGGTLKEILCIGNDITELKKAEQEKKDLELRLQRAQKMEAIGTLAGGVAHDLNNILSGLVSYPELLLMELPEDSPLKKPILTIQKSGERASAIVQDLLTLARRGVSVTEVLSLNDIVADYLKSPEHQKLKMDCPEIEIEWLPAHDLLNISGSSVHLSKVIMNLVLNAAEAMPKGGRISISTQNRYVDGVLNGYDSVAEGDYVTLTVSDGGIGIAADKMERIFEPFYTSKTMGRSGTGLGLAVVWGAVKDHNGYIDIQSAEGKGTVFTLYFPISREERTLENYRMTMDHYMGNGEKILVVDDVAEQREIASRMLEKLRYRVQTVSSGEKAVAFVKDNPVDLMVLDMIMAPGIDGLETYRRILTLKPGAKAIIASGFSETERVREAQRMGAGTYLKKPYTIEKLGLAIKGELV